MALLKIGQRRSWPRNAATEEAAVEAVPAEEEDGPLEDWTEKELAGECSTEEAAVEAALAEEEEGWPS